MQVIDTHSVDNGLVADFVGLAVVDAPFGAAAGEPGGKCVRVVVTASAPFLHDWQAAEFSAPNDQG